jgi:hypothetical protein
MKIPLVAILILLGIGDPAGLAQEKDKNTVILGKGYEKGQVSVKKLGFLVPAGWVLDKEAADKIGIYAVILPKGRKLETTNKVITIAFQKKDPNKPGLDSLSNFFKVDIQNTMAQFPDMQAARWQPSGFDPDKIAFMSIEIFGKKKDQPSPQHILMINAGDGYFSITLTAEDLKELRQVQYEEFFNSIKLQ